MLLVYLQTPRILEAITDKKTLFDMPSPIGGITLEGTLLCKFAVTDGKVCSAWSYVRYVVRGLMCYIIGPVAMKDMTLICNYGC